MTPPIDNNVRIQNQPNNPPPKNSLTMKGLLGAVAAATIGMTVINSTAMLTQRYYNSLKKQEVRAVDLVCNNVYEKMCNPDGSSCVSDYPPNKTCFSFDSNWPFKTEDICLSHHAMYGYKNATSNGGDITCSLRFSQETCDSIRKENINFPTNPNEPLLVDTIPNDYLSPEQIAELVENSNDFYKDPANLVTAKVNARCLNY